MSDPKQTLQRAAVDASGSYSPSAPRLSVSPLEPRASTRWNDWVKALYAQDDALLAELVEREPPGVALFELETHINRVYKAHDVREELARRGLPVLGLQLQKEGQDKEVDTAEQASASGQLEQRRQETMTTVWRVMPFVESIRNRLGWDVREFDLQLLRLIRRSSALSPVLGAGVSCADPCRAPSWPALVRELLQTTLDRGLEVPIPRHEDTEKTLMQASGEPGALPPSAEASAATGPDSSSSPGMRAGTTRSLTVTFEQKKVKEYTDVERQQAQDIIRKIDAWEADDEVLKNGAQLAYSLCGQHLFTLITGILYQDQRQPSAVHRAIARLAHPQHVPDRPQQNLHPGWDAIITYNFDGFMSVALTDEGIPQAAWSMRGENLAGDPNSFAKSLGPDCPWIQDVLHLHGYTPPRLFLITKIRFVFATSQYTETYDQEESAIFRKVMEQYLENPVHVALYVGCSFADRYMNGLLERSILRSPGRYHYALLKWPKERRGVQPSVEELRTEERRYLDMGVRPIWFDEFAEIPDLIARLQ